jgi:hypothetical protein
MDIRTRYNELITYIRDGLSRCDNMIAWEKSLVNISRMRDEMDHKLDITKQKINKWRDQTYALIDSHTRYLLDRVERFQFVTLASLLQQEQANKKSIDTYKKLKELIAYYDACTEKPLIPKMVTC